MLDLSSNYQSRRANNHDSNAEEWEMEIQVERQIDVEHARWTFQCQAASTFREADWPLTVNQIQSNLSNLLS